MNTPLLQRVAKLVPYPTKHSSVPALAFAYHFEPPIEQKLQLGSLFVVIEVMAKESLASQIVDLVIKTMGEEYFNKKFDDEPSTRFEKSIAALNSQLARLNESHHAKHISSLSAVVAILNQDQLYLSQCGKAHARLYRGSKLTDLAEGLNAGSSPRKTFHGIAEGTLKQKDKLLFATPAVLFEFEASSLNQLVIDNSPASCVHKMSSQLEGEASSARCAALVVELSDLEQASNEPLEGQPDTVMVGKSQTKFDEVKAAGAPLALKASGAVKAAASKSQSWWKTKAWPNAKHHSKSIWNNLWTKYINPNPRKALVIALGLVLCIGIGSYLYSANTTNYRDLVTSYKEVVALTESAEAKQSLGQVDGSAASTKSATTKLEAITNAYNTQQISRAFEMDSDLRSQKNISPQELAARLSTVNDKLSNITRLKVNNIVDFTSVKKFTANFIVQLDDRLYTVDTNAGALYQIDIARKSSSIVAQNSSLKLAVAATPSSLGDSIFILTSAPDVLQFIPGKPLTTVKLSGGNWIAGNAIASYVGNLYILSPQNDQIYRHSRTSIGFSASSSYIKRANAASVAKGTALAINGSILMVDGSTKITTFTNGIGEPASITDLATSVKGLTKLILQNEQSIIALGTNQQQIVGINLGGNGFAYKQQYLTPAGVKLKDFSVTADGTLYALSGNKVISTKL